MSTDGTVARQTWDTASLISDFVAPPLAQNGWAGTESDDTSSTGPARARIIGEVAGVDESLGKEIEELELLGRKTTDRITMRREAEISITRLASSAEFGKIYEDADFGIRGTDLHDGREQNSTESGYRVYLQLSSTTGSGAMWITGRNMKISNHQVNITPARTLQEVITFQGQLWDIDVQPVIAITAETEL